VILLPKAQYHLWNVENTEYFMKGRVKWFDAKKGYGFITPIAGGKDVFVHHSAIQMDGYRQLNEGDNVEYEVTDGTKGPQAANVTKAS